MRFEITAPPLLTGACHCTGCQQMTAGPCSLSVAVPASGFRVVAGEPAIGGLHGPSRHYHCAHCKSWMFTRPEGMDDMVNVRATMLDDHAWFSPWVETWTSEGFAWMKTGAAHSFEKLPEESAWPAMIASYAERGPRP